MEQNKSGFFWDTITEFAWRYQKEPRDTASQLAEIKIGLMRQPLRRRMRSWLIQQPKNLS